jgi:hypothetical protein
MIRVCCIIALCSGLTLRGHAQAITTGIEQLAALQTLENTVQQGYRIATGGLQTIGEIRAGEYQLHLDYFSSLDSVKPVVAGDPHVQALRSQLTTLIAQLQAELAYWQRQPILTP